MSLFSSFPPRHRTFSGKLNENVTGEFQDMGPSDSARRETQVYYGRYTPNSSATPDLCL